MGSAAKSLTPLLQVHDMKTALDFYRAVGFAVMERSGPGDDCGWCWLQLGEANLMLNTAYDIGEQPAVRDTVRAIGHGDTCNYILCPDMDAVYAELTNKGLAVTAPNITNYRMKQITLTDPDGFGLCFQWPA